ncbi:MAG: Gfo/Idh/MocA family protein [Candidatus Glassbacteria bacterium]
MSAGVRVGVVGAGYWGKNLVRNFYEIEDAELVIVCDKDRSRLESISERYPDTEVTDKFQNLLERKDVDAVVIVTPAVFHHAQAREALMAGKHVFVEKPMSMSMKEATELKDLASTGGVMLMVGHLLIYHPAVRKLRELITNGELGEVYYLYSQRVNLGRIRKDENALWSFAPHDVSVILYLLGEEPETVTATGECYLQDGIEDVVFLHMKFPDRKMAQVQLSWLDPHKERKLTVVGSRKMAVFDDVLASEKIRIYDKGIDRPPEYGSYGEYLTLRDGDIMIPRIDMKEPLRVECEHFINCVRRGERPLTDAESGVRVVRVIEAAQLSLGKRGIPIEM